MTHLWPQSPLPWIMGILNVTPDSFSDGGRFLAPPDAVAQARRMVDEGADIIDVGGESTRPGSEPVPRDQQIRRVEPIIRALRQSWDGPISVDTSQTTVAEAAFAAGANWVNDISGLRDDAALGPFVAQRGGVIVLMHMQGAPRTMQAQPTYTDVVEEVCVFLKERAETAVRTGIFQDHIIIDPGIGFGKTTAHNLALLHDLPRLVSLGYPVLVGASRKSFIGHVTKAAVGDRLAGSVAAAIWAVQAGARIVRVHDVGATRQAITMTQAIGGDRDTPARGLIRCHL